MSAGTKAYAVALAAQVLGIWLILGAGQSGWGLLCMAAGWLTYGAVRLEQFLNRRYPEQEEA